MGKIIDYNQAIKIVDAMKSIGKTTVFRSGCFDLLHIGHLTMLKNAKTLGDILIIGIGSNETVTKDRIDTYFDEKNRAETMASIGIVDYVVVLHELSNGNIDHYEFLKAVQPDVFYISLSDKQLDGKMKMAQELGIKVVSAPEIVVTNYGKIRQPHSTEFKKIMV